MIFQSKFILIFAIAFLLAMNCQKAHSQDISLEENGYQSGYFVTNTEIYSWGIGFGWWIHRFDNARN